jgi:hypothetical protein
VAVWNHSEGASSVDDLQRMVANDVGLAVDRDAIVSALRKLDRAHLLLEKVSAAGPITRRQALTRGGKLGVAAAVTPLIASALVPTAAAAASPSHICSPAGSCGTTPQCGVSGACVCFLTVDGFGFCHLPESCAGLPSCNSTLDCPTGQACVVTCCGPQSICIQPCPPGSTPAPSLHGATTIGVLP